MKTISLLLFCFWAMTSFAQEPTRTENPPGISIGKYKWQKVGPGPDVDASWKAESDSAGSSISPSEDRDSFPNRPWFVYSLEIKNDGPKPVKAIRWEYVLTDSKTHEELGRHEFENFERVGRNKAKALIAKSRLTPSRVIPAQEPAKDEKSSVVEQVILRCVIYEDGTMWEQPGTIAPQCEALKQRAKN